MAIPRSVRRRSLEALSLTAVVLVLVYWAQGRPPGAVYDGKAFTFTRIRDDVYHAVGTGNLAFGTNAVVIINDADVLLVDSHVSPAAAHVLLEELLAITTKPVRHVVKIGRAHVCTPVTL